MKDTGWYGNISVEENFWQKFILLHFVRGDLLGCHHRVQYTVCMADDEILSFLSRSCLSPLLSLPAWGMPR